MWGMKSNVVTPYTEPGLSGPPSSPDPPEIQITNPSGENVQPQNIGNTESKTVPEVIVEPRDDSMITKEKKRWNTEESVLKGYFEKKASVWTPPLTVRKQKLTNKPVKPLSGCEAWKYRQRMNWKRFRIWRHEMYYKLELWGSALKKVEGQQGTGVVSYFTFLRTLFLMDIAIFIILLLFVTIPAAAFSSNGYTSTVTGTSVSGVSTTNTATCSANYVVNVSSEAGQLVIDFLQGTGWMEKTAFFYGWYDAAELVIGTTSSHVFNYIIPLSYFLCAIIILLISLIVMARSTVKNFKESVAKKGDAHKYVYSTKVFCAWDYALEEEHWANLKQKSIQKDIAGELAEDKFKYQRENMTSQKKCQLYTIRFFINFLILCMLGGSGYLIYFVQTFSTSYTTDDNFLELLVQYLPSITLGLLNGILPLIFEFLVQKEDYTPVFVLQIHLLRIVFLKMASLAMLIITMYTTITCSTKSTDCNVNYGSCTTLFCWETYVGQAFYKLVFMDFLIHLAMPFCYELPRKLITTKSKKPFLQKIGPAVFDIPKSVLDLIYSQMLCWLGFWYAPLLSILIVISMFTNFYLKLFSALYATGPPEKPYRASRSNSFFMVILLLSFFICAFPVGYSMVSMTPSTGCGPFRIYTDASKIVTVTISNFPTGLQSFITLFTSTSAVVLMFVILFLVIYYCTARGSANNQMVQMLEEQLMMESRDKQFLMAKLYEVTGEKKPTGVHTHQKLKTVNETKTNHTDGYKDIPSKDELMKQLPDNVPASAVYSVDNLPSKDGSPHPSPQPSPQPSNHTRGDAQTNELRTATPSAIKSTVDF